jgi:hypothetical protein
MPLSNAERQKRWRDQRNKLAKQASLNGEAGNPERVEQFCANAGALLEGLIEEGKKDLATFSPNTVRLFAHLLKRQVDALSSGDELPELSPKERNHAKLLRQRVREEAKRRRIRRCGPDGDRGLRGGVVPGQPGTAELLGRRRCRHHFGRRHPACSRRALLGEREVCTGRHALRGHGPSA